MKSYGQGPRPASASEAGVQAHFGRAAKFAPAAGETTGRTRDWSVFLFFRILKQAEARIFLSRLADMIHPDAKATLAAQSRDISRGLGNPGLVETGAAAQQAAAPTPPPPGAAPAPMPDDPADAFLRWLRLAVNADASGVSASLKDLIGVLAPGGANGTLGRMIPTPDDIANQLAHIIRLLPVEPGTEMAAVIARLRQAAMAIIAAKGGGPETTGRAAIREGLIGVCVQEVLRQLEPTHASVAGSVGAGVLQSEADRVSEVPSGPYDRAPINLAFSYRGLEALKLDPDTLATFPDAFREGMAARAARLHDTGPSAPENWYGELGQPSVHGYFTGGFLADGGAGKPDALTEQHWKNLRAQVRAYNERTADGQLLRTIIGAVFRLFGMEIVHIELGQDPYEVGQDGAIVRSPWRIEHFGFRDGLSQPFVDLGLGMPPRGGGTPRRDRTWAPIAPGEIFLGLPDEDGARVAEPRHPTLRNGGTYLVFRKLEQDVVGFRNFLAAQRPDDPAAQKKLSAELVGRWPGGASLVRAPDRELMPAESDLNDFLYMADDPKGRRCPLGAHVRRSNPRDIGGRDDVRRHRILRRSVSYGGPLLPDGSMGDGEDRGILFVAANSRIDLQFEVIQGDWLNTGEFLGQAGLGRCPLLGANDGKQKDAFLEAGKGTPVTGLPRFIVNRGGDYFFLPSVHALKAIAAGDRFDFDPHMSPDMPFRGASYADAKTSELFEETRIRGYIPRILGTPQHCVTVEMPDSRWSPESGAAAPADPARQTVKFIGMNRDVWHVLHGLDPMTRELVFSVEHYAVSSKRLSRHVEFIIGTDHGSPTAAARIRQKQLLGDAWMKLDAMLKATTNGQVGVRERLSEINQSTLEGALRRVCQTGRVDLVKDFATEVAYRVSADLMGVPGPDGLTEMALALPFAKRHLTEAPEDWIARLKGKLPDNPRLVTLQLWSALIFAEVVGNVSMRRELAGLAQQAASEFFGHLDDVVAVARAYSAGRLPTLVDAFIALTPQGSPQLAEQHATDMRVLLAELSGSAIGIIPGVFGTVMEALMDDRIDLQRILPILEKDPAYWPGPEKYPLNGVQQLIYETTRRKPSAQIMMRRCVKDFTLPSGVQVKSGEWVAAVMAAAGLDPTAFPDSWMFSLYPWVKGPARPPEKFFLFGAHGGDRQCWGRDRMALEILSQCVRAAGKLPGLHRVAGAKRGFEVFAGSKIGLLGRFAPFRYGGGL